MLRFLGNRKMNNTLVQLYTPQPLQFKIHNSPARFRVFACGRRWGKNYLAHNEMMKYAWEHPNSLSWWTAPIHQQAKRDYNRFLFYFKYAIQKKHDTDLNITLKNGSRIEFHGLEKHENLLGEGINFLCIDEAGKVRAKAWQETLRPMLSDTQGNALIFGTPKGKNWFYQEWKRGMDYLENYEAFCFPTASNKYIPAEEIRHAQETLPEIVYRQEYLAEFLDDSMVALSGYMACIYGELEEPQIGKYYTIGADLAKEVDFTVLTVIETDTRRVVAFERFNQLEWSFQRRKIVELAKRYNNADVILDSTGVGNPIYEDLKRQGLFITPYHFTYQSKIDLIENLMIKIQNREVSYPAIPELLDEMGVFELTRTPSGKITYRAKEGHHDDCVISLALAMIETKPVVRSLAGLDFNEEELSSEFDIM